MKIVDLRSVLMKYVAHMERARKRGGAAGSGTVTLQMAGGQSATLEIGAQVTVSAEETGNVLKLSELEMVRLLFGLVKPSETFQLGPEFLVLDSIFPLDCFIWLTDTV